MPHKLLVAVISTCCLFAQSDWRHADPECNLIAGLNWRALQSTALGPILKAAILRNPIAASFEATIDQVDSITWSSRSYQQDDGRTVTEWVAAITGTFDLDALSTQFAAIGYLSQPYRSIALLTPAKVPSKRVHVVLLDAQTILVADADPLRRAVDRVFDSPTSGSPLLARASELAQNNELWVAGAGSPLGFYRKKIPEVVSGLPTIQAYTVGLTLGDSPLLRLSLTASDAQKAEVFLQLLRLVPYLVKLRPAERQVVDTFWSQAQFTQEGETTQAVFPLELLLRAVVP